MHNRKEQRGPIKIEWMAHEHHHQNRSNDWYWGIGIIAILLAVLAIYFGNIVLAMFIVLAGFTSILQAHAKPKVIKYSITRKGIKAGESSFPFSTLESFWVIDEDVDDKIILRSTKFMMPFIVLPYDSTNTDPEEIRDYLLEYIDEEEMQEPFMQIVLEKLGF